MVKKLCNYIEETNIISDTGEWNDCRRLGNVRPKTCEKCAFNIKNKELMEKARRYYRVVK